MRRQRLQICLEAPDEALVLFDLCWEVFEKLVLQPVLLALMVGLHDFQLGDLHIKVHALLDANIPRAQGLDLREGQGCFVNVLAGAHRGFGSHDLRNELLLVFYRLPEICVEGPLRDVAADMDQRILVALALDAAFSLGQVTGPPGAVKVVERDQAILDVGASAHLLGASDEDAHLTGADFGEQLPFPYLGVGVVDERDLILRHPAPDELLADVLIDCEGALLFLRLHRDQAFQRVKLRVIQDTARRFRGPFRDRPAFGCGNIAENQLCQALRRAVPPELQDIADALIDLCSVLVGEQGVDDPLVQTQLAPIRRDLEHIVLMGVHGPAVDQRGPLGQTLDHLLLDLRGFRYEIVILHLRRRQVELVGSLDVRDLLEHRHQLRQVEELGEARPGAVARPLRGQLQRRGGFPKA